MLEVLTFILSGFWIWLGTMLLVGAVSVGFARIIYSVRGQRCNCDDEV